MEDTHDIIAFSSEGEKVLGVVIFHYSNPLDDFYIIYADYALHKSHSSNEDAEIVLENIIIPACDKALADYRLKRQHLKDMDTFHREFKALVDALNSKMNVDGIVSNDDIDL